MPHAPATETRDAAPEARAAEKFHEGQQVSWIRSYGPRRRMRGAWGCGLARAVPATVVRVGESAVTILASDGEHRVRRSDLETIS